MVIQPPTAKPENIRHNTWIQYSGRKAEINPLIVSNSNPANHDFFRPYLKQNKYKVGREPS